jgi:hypothetical protein
MDIKDIQFTEEEIERKMQKSPTLKTIFNLSKNLSYLSSFKVGQVLVRRYLTTNRIATNAAGIAEKYIVVNIMNGIPLCKKLQVSGKPGIGLYCPADVDYDKERFEEDPDCADAILLGAEYDPLELPKKVAKIRTKVMAYNNKISLRNVLQNDFADGRLHSKTSEQIIDILRQSMSNDGATLKLWQIASDDKSKRVVNFTFNRTQDNTWEIQQNGAPVSTWTLTAVYCQYYVEEPKLIKEYLE